MHFNIYAGPQSTNPNLAQFGTFERTKFRVNLKQRQCTSEQLFVNTFLAFKS